MSVINQNLSDYRGMAGDARQQFNLEENLREAQITANDMHKNFVESLSLPLATPLLEKPIEGLLKAGAKKMGFDGTKLVEAVKSGDVQGVAQEMKGAKAGAQSVRQAVEDNLGKTKNAIIDQVNSIKSKIPNKGLSDLVGDQESLFKGYGSSISSKNVNVIGSTKPKSVELQDIGSPSGANSENVSNLDYFNSLFDDNLQPIPQTVRSVSSISSKNVNVNLGDTSILDSAKNDMNEWGSKLNENGLDIFNKTAKGLNPTNLEELNDQHSLLKMLAKENDMTNSNPSDDKDFSVDFDAKGIENQAKSEIQDNLAKVNDAGRAVYKSQQGGRVATNLDELNQEHSLAQGIRSEPEYGGPRPVAADAPTLPSGSGGVGDIEGNAFGKGVLSTQDGDLSSLGSSANKLTLQQAQQFTQAPAENEGEAFGNLAQKVGGIDSKLSSSMGEEGTSLASRLAAAAKAAGEADVDLAPEEEAGGEFGLGLAALAGAGAFLGTIFGSHKEMPKLPAQLVPSMQFGVTE